VNLVAVTKAAAESGAHTAAWMLAALSMPYWEQRMLWPEWIATHLAGLDAARAAREPIGEARMLIGLTSAYRRAGDLPRAVAYAEEALDVHRSLGDQQRVLALLDTLAMIDWERGEPERAAALLEQIVGDPAADAFRRSTSLLHLSLIRRGLGALETSIALSDQAVEVARTAGLPHCEVAALAGLGATRVLAGRPRPALVPLTRAVELAVELDDRIHQAEARRNLGLAWQALADPVRAIAELSAAVELMASLGHPDERTARRELAAITT
jgi:tetratricopeptide (TPR) repeat protein